MNAHIQNSEADKLINKELNERFKKVSENSFMLGAHSISEMIAKDYLPPIENAATDEKRTQAIADLKKFLGNGSKLNVAMQQEVGTTDENSIQV